MRRLLLGAVVVELVVGGLALTAESGGIRQSPVPGTSRTAPLPGHSASDSGSESMAAGATRFIAALFGSVRGESASTSEALAMATVSAGPVHGRSSPLGNQISFKEPVDFATGAVPSSAGFNAASGDQVAMVLTRSGDLSDSVAVGDFNHDGKPDVAQTNVAAGSLSVLLGDGRGRFASPTVYQVGVHPNFVVAGHLDRDRHLDLAVATTDSNAVALLFGEGDGTFRLGSFFSVPAPRNVAIGDFNGDANADLAVASRRPAATPPVPPGGLAIATGDGDGSFVQTQFLTLTHSSNDSPVGANFVAVGDFNGGGFDDITVAVGNSKSAGDRQPGDTKPTGDDLLVFLNRNETTDTAPPEPFSTEPDQPAIRVGASPDAIAVSHLNGDTHLDLAVMANASGDMTTLLGDSQGRFVVRATNTTASGIPRAVAVGDFNDDGIRDLVTANFHGSTVSVLQGNGDGTFQPAVEFWSGDGTTGVGVGDFDGDRRVDIVAGRLRDDELALLRNDSPRPSDEVVVTRDIPYGSPTHSTDDPFAAHHVLDVYTPPPGTTSLNGRGRPYPVAMFVHGGAGVAGDKAMGAYVMRRLALEGVVAVAIDYRLKPALPDAAGQDEQTRDVAHAFRWVRDHVGSSAYGGDPERIFIFSHSWGSLLAAKFGTEPGKWADQQHIRGLVLVSFCPPAVSRPTPTQRRSLLLTGTEGFEAGCDPHSDAFSRTSKALGAQSEHQTVVGRDHMTVLANIARAGDPAREAMLEFMRDP